MFRRSRPEGPCPLCGRDLENSSHVDYHHLLPRSKGGVEAYAIHRDCHTKIHSVLSNSELQAYYHTWDRLREHEELSRFIKWVRKQSEGRLVKHHRRKKP